jgi:branched-chain amino acid transport system substrate-binding protein
MAEAKARAAQPARPEETTMKLNRRMFVGGGMASAGLIWTLGNARAQAANTIRIGHITDMSGVYRDVEGPTSVACVKQAVDEFVTENPDFKVDILVADHQNKADVGLAIIRRWFDESGVDVITNVGNSSVALGAKTIVEDKNKVALISSAGSSDLTGKSCSANMVHWAWDSWCLAHSTATSLVKTGGDKWFFVTADYAFGHAAQADATKFIEAAGGKVLGSVRYPYGVTSDFSSFLLQAQSSGANTVAFANSGADLINCLKQAQEFGLADSARLAAMVGYITDVLGMGLPVAKGLTLTETFYWDLNDRTRAFMQRIAPKLDSGGFPNMSQAGDYSATRHYLKAVKALGAARAKGSGREVVEMMKTMPTDDDCFGKGLVRADGRKIHPAYLFEVKKPEDSASRGDIYKLVSTLPADEAFRPMAEGNCPLVHA